MDKKKLKHDIIGDTEAVKNVLSMIRENIADKDLQQLANSSMERMDKIQQDFLKLLECIE